MAVGLGTALPVGYLADKTKRSRVIGCAHTTRGHFAVPLQAAGGVGDHMPQRDCNLQNRLGPAWKSKPLYISRSCAARGAVVARSVTQV
eukprot:1842750-Pyramimonas_sp.AAC.1